MDELFVVVLVVGILLTFVTIVGHGIWVVLSHLFGRPREVLPHTSPLETRSNIVPPETRPTRVECVQCGALIGGHLRVCPLCGGEQPDVVRASDRIALSAVRQQINELAQRGLFDDKTRARLLTTIADEVRRIDQESQLGRPQTAVHPVAAIVPPADSQPLPSAVNDNVAEQAESPVAPASLTPLPPLSPDERARKYAQSRKAAHVEALAESAASDAPADPPKKREALSRIFAAFMEEKNIRWGELVGGVLIVGCSVALVISFWSQIAAQPLLKFVLFNGVTAALFGVGLYTDSRWKIHTTSHGILVIATLLVPLNFLAIAAFTQASPPTDLFSLAGEALSLVVFALLVVVAGRVLVPDDKVPLVVGVMVPCLMQLLVRRFGNPTAPLITLYALAITPIATYAATTAISIRRRWTPEPPLAESEAHRVLVFLGLVSVSMVMPIALLLHFVTPIRMTLHWLSPVLTLLGLPALGAGLLFWRKLTDKALAGLQTAGIAVGALGAAVMLAAIVLAWPDPATMLPVAVAIAVAMIGVAFAFGIPAAHLPSAIAISIAWLVSFYLLRGDVGWTLARPSSMKDALLSATSGHVLVPLVAMFGAQGWWLRRQRRKEDGAMLAIAAVATAAASLALVVWFGFGRDGDPAGATWTLAIYAAAAIAAGVLLSRPDVARVGSAIMFATLVQGIVYRFQITWQLEHPWIVAFLAHATIVATGCALLVLIERKRYATSALSGARGRDVIQSLNFTAQVTSLAAAAWIVATLQATTATSGGINLAWLAGVWILLAAFAASPSWFTAAQAALAVAVVCGVVAAVERYAWYAAPHPWLDPWFLQAQGIALAVYCVLFGVGRRVIARHTGETDNHVVAPQPSAWLTTTARLFNPSWPAIDRVVATGLVTLAVGMAIYAAAPGAAQEWSPTEVPGERAVPPIERFELAGIPHAHAAGLGAWLLLVSVAAALASSPSGNKTIPHRTAGLAVLAMSACPLLAAFWEPLVAVGSALRWLSAGLFAVASFAIWRFSRLQAVDFVSASNEEIQRESIASISPIPDRPRILRDLGVGSVVLVYVVMAAFIGQATLMRTSFDRSVQAIWYWAAIWAIFAAATGLVASSMTTGHLRSFAKFSSNVPNWFLYARNLLQLLAFAPIAVLAAFTIARALAQRPLVGPEPGSWFVRIGYESSYGIPLAVIALTFIGYAVCHRSAGFALAAGLLFNIVATLVVLLRLARAGGALDAAAWINVAQVNALVSGIVAICWLAAVATRGARIAVSQRAESQSVPPGYPLLLSTQVALAAALCAGFLVPAVAVLVLDKSPATWTMAADGVLGWSAAAVAILAAVWLHRGKVIDQPAVAGFAAALIALLALTIARYDTGNFEAYHTLLAGSCTAAWLLPPLTRAANRVMAPTVAADSAASWSAPSASLFAIAGVLLAFWGHGDDPARPWWTITALVAISARSLWIAYRDGGRGKAWIAAILFISAVWLLWFDWGSKFSATRGFGALCEFLWVNVLAAAVIALASIWIERAWRTAASEHTGGMEATWRPGRVALAFHRFAAWAMVVLLITTTAAGLIADLSRDSFSASWLLGWSAWSAAALVAAASLWDPAVRWSVACLYCVGLIAVGMYLDRLDLQAPLFHWALANALAAYSLATSALWSVRERLSAVVSRLGAPAEASPNETGHGWLVSANILIGVIVLLLVWLIELTMHGFPLRMVAAYAVGAQVFAIGLLAHGTVRTPLQYLALMWGVVFAIAFGWAWMRPDFPAPWLHRLVIAVVALVVTIVVYGFGLVKFWKRENEWTRAAERLVPSLAGVATVFILVVLGMEVAEYVRERHVPISPAALVAVAIALAGLAAGALVAALVPGRDPLGLSERGRTLYVYAAEALAALLFLHIRVTMDWLFTGWFMRFWPIIVMSIAFVGVGLAEVFQRRQQRVLAEPLETTGALLPLLPALGFWIVSSHVDYSLLLLSIGVLYTALSVLRSSLLYGMLATIAANGALWYFLSRQDGLDLTQHPQLWLVPPALCAIAAAYINRHRLTREQSAAIRYASAIVIYASSTAEIFIHGVAEAPWLPAVLAGLSIAGVLAGIMLRVRAFLYLGVTFLVVALLTIIWHAAEQWTWIWWVAGIVTGILILAVFGLIEKRRDDVLRMVEQIKHWQA